MWRLVFTIISYLNTDIVNAYYVLNASAVTWRDAQNICNVPSVHDIMHTEIAYTELPTPFTAWTSSFSRTSDWAYFYGCLDVSVNMIRNDIKRKLFQYFPNSKNASESESVFKCAYLCTRNGDFFTFFRRFCKCIHQNELTSGIVQRPVCMSTDLKIAHNIDAVYSISHSSLPIFKFESEFSTKGIQKSGIEGIKYNCLTKRKDGTFISNNCSSNNIIHCADGHRAYGTWSYAINLCLLRNESLLKERNNSSDYWLGYFMYEEDESNQRCGAILRNDITQPPTYQFRPCSDHLHVLCMDETDSSFISTSISINSDNQIPANSTESAFDVSFKPTSTQIADVQRSGVKNNTFVVGEVVIVNIVLFGLCIFVVILIFLRKRLTLQVCQAAKQKFQRCNITKNPMVQTNGNSEMNIRNKTKLVRDSYDETRELRRNIVHIGELYQQDIINVQTEETEI